MNVPSLFRTLRQASAFGETDPVEAFMATATTTTGAASSTTAAGQDQANPYAGSARRARSGKRKEGHKKKRKRDNRTEEPDPNTQHYNEEQEDNRQQEANRQQADYEQEEDEAQKLLERARFYCQTAEEWRVISQLSPAAVERFVEAKAFEGSQKVAQSVVKIAHYALAQFMDQLSRGNGFVAAEISSDMSLAESLHLELATFAQYLNNRIKILALVGVDVFHGKKRQRRLGGQPPGERLSPIREEINEQEGDGEGAASFVGADE